jgi:phosphatidylglycerophosphatase A
VNRFREPIVLFIVTGAGAGYSPWLPGTVGTFIATPFSLALNRIAESNFLFATVLLSDQLAAPYGYAPSWPLC